MQIFRVNKNIEVVCKSESTRYGFRHLATLMIDGREAETAKHCYYNRTWERYTFESVLEALVEKSTSLTDSRKRTLKRYIKNYDRVHDDLAGLRSISAGMALGDIFSTDKKGANDWKTRMLKAGLEHKGLIMPDDWDTLDEATKEVRLNGVIHAIR